MREVMRAKIGITCRMEPATSRVERTFHSSRAPARCRTLMYAHMTLRVTLAAKPLKTQHLALIPASRAFHLYLEVTLKGNTRFEHNVKC